MTHSDRLFVVACAFALLCLGAWVLDPVLARYSLTIRPVMSSCTATAQLPAAGALSVNPFAGPLP